MVTSPLNHHGFTVTHEKSSADPRPLHVSSFLSYDLGSRWFHFGAPSSQQAATPIFVPGDVRAGSTYIHSFKL